MNAFLKDDANDTEYRLTNVHSNENIEEFAHLAILEELVGGVAHNFGNVLMGILSSLELIQIKSEKHPEVYDFKDIIQRSINTVDKGAEIVQCLLSFCRDTPFIIEQVSLRNVVDNALTLCSFYQKAKKLNFVKNIPDNIGDIAADAKRLEEILTNLIINAMQASEKGTITISARELYDKGKVIICIEDEGCGIEQKDINKIFLSSYSKRHDGSSGKGLGLAYSLTQINAMLGTISVESEPGKGSKFEIALPKWEPDIYRVLQNHNGG